MTQPPGTRQSIWRSRPARVAAALGAFAIAAALTTGAAILLLDANEDSVMPPAPDPTATAAATATSPQTAGTANVLDAPGSGGLLRGTLTPGTPLRIEGRSEDGEWLAIAQLGPDGRAVPAPVTGWLPLGAVAGAPDVGALAVVDARAFRSALPAPSPTADTEARPTLTPDLPDLVISDVFARQNQLVVVVSNNGNGDADGAIEVSVDGGPFVRIDTGKALRPGDELERVVAGQYVQRRSRVSIALRAPGIEEGDVDNNASSIVVAPDMYNDIEVLSVEVDPDGGHLVVQVRNNSPIPLSGELTLGVRGAAADGSLLLRDNFDLDVEAGATSRYDLRALTGVEAASVLVIVSTDAISDADSQNNTYPR